MMTAKLLLPNIGPIINPAIKAWIKTMMALWMCGNSRPMLKAAAAAVIRICGDGLARAYKKQPLHQKGLFVFSKS